MKVLCIGNSAYDITFPVDEYPKENVKYKIQEQIECGGGSCGNAAYLLAKWGIETYFVGMVGDDVYGKRIRDEFRTIGVNTDYLILAPNYRTTTSHIIVNKENGSRTILSYHPSQREMDDLDIELEEEPKVILLDGREFSMSKKMIEKYPNAKKIIDASNDKLEVKELCKLCDYVVCSKDFMKKVSGIDIDDLNNLNAAFKVLEEMFNTTVVVTLEALGCAYRKYDEIVIVPTIQVKAVDTTGSGDIFHGAFAYAMMKNWDMETSLKFSNLVGSLATTKYGGRNSMFELKDVEKVFNEIK